jgi:rfaE bifunctional protein nucleotidyltransferase chain/domain
MEGVQGHGLREGGSLRVHCHGCFDLLHWGHLKHLKEAKSLGTELIVTVTADEYVNKGPGRPFFNQWQRQEMLQELRFVDEVRITTSAEVAIRSVKPDIYVKGKEYENKLPEQKLVESLGGRVHFTQGPVYSSTELINGAHLRLSCIGSG